VFVLASRYEGLPLSVLEAMRAGLPVIASDVGGTGEAVEDGVSGFLVPRGDRACLQDRIARLLNDEDLRHRMGAKGRKRFEQSFSSQGMVESIRGIYEAMGQAVLREPVTSSAQAGARRLADLLFWRR
jgi:glycosyltransferase involved in cell wall biosynthesis